MAPTEVRVAKSQV